MFDTLLALRKPETRVFNAHTRVRHAACCENSNMCNPNVQIKIYSAGQEMMYQQSFPSIVFWLLQSSLSFCVPTYWMLVLGRRSAILHDNRYMGFLINPMSC